MSSVIALEWRLQEEEREREGWTGEDAGGVVIWMGWKRGGDARLFVVAVLFWEGSNGSACGTRSRYVVAAKREESGRAWPARRVKYRQSGVLFDGVAVRRRLQSSAVEASGACWKPRTARRFVMDQGSLVR